MFRRLVGICQITPAVAGNADLFPDLRRMFQDSYLRACARLGVAPKDAIIFEDAFAGIASAHAAGAGAIVAITATNPASALANLPGVRAVIDDYRDLDAVLSRLC